MEINAIRVVFPATFGHQSHQSHLTPRRADSARSRHHLARRLSAVQGRHRSPGRIELDRQVSPRTEHKKSVQGALPCLAGALRGGPLGARSGGLQGRLLHHRAAVYHHLAGRELRALDYFRRSGADPDPRMAAAVAVVRSRRQPDGRWLLDRVHPGRVRFDLEGGVGTPSRWNTLAAVIACISSCSSWSAAAARLSSRCAGVAVPGMGSVTGETASSQARAIWLVFALCRERLP